MVYVKLWSHLLCVDPFYLVIIVIAYIILCILQPLSALDINVDGSLAVVGSWDNNV